jgi:hypothetical protein
VRDRRVRTGRRTIPFSGGFGIYDPSGMIESKGQAEGSL